MTPTMLSRCGGIGPSRLVMACLSYGAYVRSRHSYRVEGWRFRGFESTWMFLRDLLPASPVRGLKSRYDSSPRSCVLYCMGGVTPFDA